VSTAIDVHCHLQSPDFDGDRDAVLQRAARAGVRLVLAMGEHEADNSRVLELARVHRALLPCLGLHPDRAGSEAVEAVERQIRAHVAQIAAIGEIGLDYFVAERDEERRVQRQVLERLIALALELDLPISVHSRSAGHQTIDLLASCAARRVCLHGFDGGAKHAVRAADLGYLLSIPPSVVRSPQKQNVVRRLPLSALLLETDSPVLGPEAGVRNEPANVIVAAARIAEIKRSSVEEVLAVTTAGARRLFRLEPAPGS